MDVLLLGLAALVLIGLTLWIVWHPAPAVRPPQEASQMLPQGDTFEDQYTSATADLSAGGIAVTTSASAPPEPEEPVVSDFQTASEPWSAPSLAREGTPAALPPPPTTRELMSGRTVGIGAAALLTLGGAVGGAWLYSRWTRQRNKPLNRLLRRLS